MEDHNIDDARMANCRVTKNMPTTANKSVWRVVMGTRKAFGETSDEFEAVFDAVKDHCSGVAWGASVPNSGTGNLGGDLLDILQGGEPLKDENGNEWPINYEADFGLNMNTDTLDYFDPGLVPVEFGEHPEDVFDVQE